MSVENIITENLDIWTSTIKTKLASGRGSSNKFELYGIKKLRELILDLAMRGKLILPEKGDGSVDTLLDLIEQEKVQLTKSKQIKKPKIQPVSGLEDIPFNLPTGWQWVRLGTIGTIFNGNSVNATQKEEKYTGLDCGLPYIATKDVGYGFTELDYDNGVLIPHDEPKFKVARAGAVLICAEGGSAGKKCGLASRDICFGNKLFANQLYGNISPKFILYCYLSPFFYSLFTESMTGIIGGISATKFNELLIPLPPLSYQKRLVQKVDKLMHLCDLIESQTEASIEAHQTLVESLLDSLTNAKNADELNDSWQRISEHFDVLFTTEDSIDQLKQTILQLAVMGKLVKQDPSDEPALKMLERIAAEREQLIKDKKTKKVKSNNQIENSAFPFDAPKGWQSIYCEEAADPKTVITYGILKPVWKSDGVPTLRIQDMVNGNISDKNVGYCCEERASKFEKTKLKKGDLLIAKDGATLGKTAFVPEHYEGGNITQHVLRFSISRFLDAEFIRLVIDSPIGQQFMKGETKGVALPGVNVGDFRKMVIMLPPLNEQKRIVAKVQKLTKLLTALSHKISKSTKTKVLLSSSMVNTIS